MMEPALSCCNEIFDLITSELIYFFPTFPYLFLSLLCLFSSRSCTIILRSHWWSDVPVCGCFHVTQESLQTSHPNDYCFESVSCTIHHLLILLLFHSQSPSHAKIIFLIWFYCASSSLQCKNQVVSSLCLSISHSSVSVFACRRYLTCIFRLISEHT